MSASLPISPRLSIFVWSNFDEEVKDMARENADQIRNRGVSHQHGEREHGPRVLEPSQFNAKYGHSQVLIPATPHI